MRIYVFETINGVVIRKAAKSTDKAIVWFKEKLIQPVLFLVSMNSSHKQDKLKKY